MNGKFIFHTKYEYKDRETKAKYVWLKYRPILKGKILDVGADECYLRQYLDNPASYLGIGLGGNPDQKVDLERESIPFPDNSFGCVLCLDVLEHLDNIHKVFDDLCRVSRRYVVISLPNPWASFWSILRSGGYQPDQPTKFYGLPPEPPADRHKWFFSNEEAKNFVSYRATKNGMRVLQMDNYGNTGKGGWKHLLQNLAIRTLLNKDLNVENLHTGTLWAVLEKETNG